MTITIQLDPELYNQIRALVYAELDRQKNRQRIEQLAMKIRAQLDQLSGPKAGPQVVQSLSGAVPHQSLIRVNVASI